MFPLIYPQSKSCWHRSVLKDRREACWREGRLGLGWCYWARCPNSSISLTSLNLNRGYEISKKFFPVEDKGWIERLSRDVGLLHRSCIVAEGQRGAGDDWYLAWETGGMIDSCEGPGMVTMLGGQLVTLLLKSGFWSHSTVGSSSLICRIATTYHHQCQFYVCVCVCVCLCV